MHWGYQQGCDFISSRCGTNLNDYSVSVSGAGDCSGQSWWGSVYDSYLQSKCQPGGTNPCDGGAGYLQRPDGSKVCNAQCASSSVSSRTDCSQAPAGSIEQRSTEEELQVTHCNACNACSSVL